MALFVGTVNLSAVTRTFDNDGGDNVWGNNLNWDADTLPTGADVVNLGSFVVEVNAAGATYDTPTGSTGATVNINNGGVLTTGANNFNSLRNIGPINIKNGGTLQAGAVFNRTDITVDTGGLLSGIGGMQDNGSFIVLNGGIWEPAPTTGSPEESIFIRNTTLFDLGTGTVRLDLFSDIAFERFLIEDTSSATLLLNTGAIQLVVDAGYSPTAGDSFSVVAIEAGGSPTVTYGDGSNVSLTGAGAAGFTLDTSAWATNGTVTVVAVPEPTSGLLALGGIAFLMTRRRRSRR